MRNLRLGVLCIGVLSVILVLGLWPFHSPRNEVTWLKDRNGISFGDYGTVMSIGSLNGTGLRKQAPCSIELWIKPANDDGGTILTFYAPGRPLEFSLHQSITDLMLQCEGLVSPDRARKQRMYVRGVLRQGRPVFVTVTSGGHGTIAYLNGALALTAQGFQPRDCAGRLIVGDSPRQQDNWSGQIKGLAIYYSELTPPAVLRHYNAWTQKGQPEVDRNEHILALYLFDERAGDIVRNHASRGLDLFIPGIYTVLDHLRLEPFWDEFSTSRGYWKNIVKNIVGFVPLGFCFSAYFTAVLKTKRAALVAIVFGSVVSLTIEVLQGYLPTRDSGTTDIITNTLGTWLGVTLYKAARPQWGLCEQSEGKEQGRD
jgi:VanZ family protein